MKIKEIIGIDVSKLYLDVHLHYKGISSEFDNTVQGIGQLLAWVEKSSGFEREAVFFVFEHTGLYSYQLSELLSELGLNYTMEPGLAVRRSLGITRGKDDAIDAKKLALYGYRLRDELTPYQLADQDIQVLQSLLTLRDRMVRQRSGYKASLKEQQRVLQGDQYELLITTQKQLIVEFNRQIKQVEARIRAIIQANAKLKKLYQLITSVKGVGPQTAYHLMVCTNAFNRFTKWRPFAAYCGTAPFPYRSGSSIRGRTKVSHLANKKIKTLMDMCAKSAIQHDPQLKAYYQRKLKQGKKRMSVVNAVRNKIIARIFAVVNRQSPFVDTYKFAA